MVGCKACNWLPHGVAKMEMIEEFTGKFDTLMICCHPVSYLCEGEKSSCVKEA
jgi:hypothetical protein